MTRTLIFGLWRRPPRRRAACSRPRLGRPCLLCRPRSGRPPSAVRTPFVLIGLYGPALALLSSVAVLGFASTARRSIRLRRAATTQVGVVGIGLVLRGVVLEVLLGWNVGGLAKQVGPLETHWSLILMNPWFTLGGALFVATAIRLRREGTYARPSPLTGWRAGLSGSCG